MDRLLSHRRVVFVLSAAALWIASSAHAASLRCGTFLVSDFATQAEVLAKCGEPVSSTTRHLTLRTHVGPGQDVYEEVQIDTWFYDFGANRLTQLVTFRNGLLVDVTSGKYGTGEKRRD